MLDECSFEAGWGVVGRVRDAMPRRWVVRHMPDAREECEMLCYAGVCLNNADACRLGRMREDPSRERIDEAHI